MRGNRSALERWLQMAERYGDEPPHKARAASHDPYETLGVALQAVIEHAVATAVAAFPQPGAADSSDAVGSPSRKATRRRHHQAQATHCFGSS